MNFTHLLSRETMNKLSRLNRQSLLSNPIFYRYFSSITAPVSSLEAHGSTTLPQNPNVSLPCFSRNRYIHSTRETRLSSSAALAKVEALGSDDSEDDDGTMNQFLSRFAWIMRGKLVEVNRDLDKQTIDGMLLLIVEKVVSEMEKGGLEQVLGAGVISQSSEFSEDLWKTVYEVSNMVLADMEKERKKEKMKKFLQSERVNELCRFAGEVGVRGDLLRELRFKFAREELEEVEFYESLEILRKEDRALGKETVKAGTKAETFGEDGVGAEEKPRVITLPKRHGRIKYKIYGLDLSAPKWAEAADKVKEAGEDIWPEEAKPITGKCKLVTDRILSLKDEEDPSPHLTEWIELLQPNRSDWNNLLDRLKEQNTHLHLKVAELILSEASFQASDRDYWKLIDAHAKANRLEDTERIVEKMTGNGILPDFLIYNVLVHMYSKAGILDRAKEAFESVKSHGVPDMKVYTSMIMAYVNAGEPRMAESLIRELEKMNKYLEKKIYIAILRSYAQIGDISGAGRIVTSMQFAGLKPTRESCALLVEACGQSGDPDQARSNFDYMLKLGHIPDDRCTASMISAYQRKNLLDKALGLLLELEKTGFQAGVATWTVLLDWMAELQLIDEAEALLNKIALQGEAPSYKVHLSLCSMYARARVEKKALQSLKVLEAKKKQLRPEDFERIISSLMAGGFMQEAQRICELMESQGFQVSESLKVPLMSAQMHRLRNKPRSV